MCRICGTNKLYKISWRVYTYMFRIKELRSQEVAVQVGDQRQNSLWKFNGAGMDQI